MNTTVVISGGSEGLGYATAKLLAKNYNVYILSPTEEKLASAANEIGCKYKVCDVTKWDMVHSAVTEIVEEAGKIDICINNAGVWIEGELDANEPEKIHNTLEVNVLGVMLLSKAVIPHMKKMQTGIILNVISQAGINAKADRSVYYASKWAITGFTKCLYLDLLKYGIRVMGIYPGKMNTKIFETAGIPKDMKGSLEPADVAKTIEFMLQSSSTVAHTDVVMMDTTVY